MVIVKLSTPRLQALWLTVTKELGMGAPEEIASGVSLAAEPLPEEG